MPQDEFTTEFAPPPRSDRLLRALLGDLINQLTLLVRQELALFKAELGENAGRMARGGVMLAVGAVLAFSGWLALMVAAGAALALVLPPWAAALIVGGVVIVIGALLALIGKSRVNPDRLVPERALRSLREDELWIKERLR